jgi:hypothetical protein
MNAIKQYFKYVNQWNVMFYTLVFLQLALGWEDGHYDWGNVWGAGLVWVLYMLGYNALDRELEIKLDRAKEAIAKDEHSRV